MNNIPNRRTIFIKGGIGSKITEYTYPSGKKGFIIDGVWLTPEGSADSAGLIACRKQCFVDDGNCLGQQWRVKFPNPALPNGSTLTRKVGFSFQFEKDIDQMNAETASVQALQRTFMYPFDETSTVTAAQLAAWAIEKINYRANEVDDNLGMKAILDPADGANETIILYTENCARFKVYNATTTGLSPVTGNVVVTKIYDGLEQVSYTKDNLRDTFPAEHGIRSIAGGFGPSKEYSFFSDCKSPCMLQISGCLDYCTMANQPNGSNAYMPPTYELTIFYDAAESTPITGPAASLMAGCTERCSYVFQRAVSGVGNNPALTIITGTVNSGSLTTTTLTPDAAASTALGGFAALATTALKVAALNAGYAKSATSLGYNLSFEARVVGGVEYFYANIVPISSHTRFVVTGFTINTTNSPVTIQGGCCKLGKVTSTPGANGYTLTVFNTSGETVTTTAANFTLTLAAFVTQANASNRYRVSSGFSVIDGKNVFYVCGDVKYSIEPAA